MKKTLIFVCIAVLLLGGGIFGSWYVLTHKQSERIARIYQQDKLLYEIDLSTVQKAYTITIDGENGAENVVLVEPGQISMQSASCPDHLCVKQGTISDGILPIVCLPNHIRISIASDEEGSFDVQVRYASGHACHVYYHGADDLRG